MIEYTCAKCGTFMASPDSLAGHTDTCPDCENVCSVPQRKDVAVVARAYGAGASVFRRIVRFCKRRKKLVSILAVNVVLLTGLLSWLLPGWLPRPVLTIEIPAKSRGGLFPARPEMGRLLEKHGYYAESTLGTIGVLRGRRLARRDYTKDANNSAWARCSLWSPMDDSQHIIAISSSVFNPEVLDPRRFPVASIQKPLILSHADSYSKLIEELSTIRVFKQRDFASVGEYWAADQPVLEARVTGGGFALNILGVCEDSKAGREVITISLILKDKSWK